MYTENCSNDLQSPDASTVRTFLKVVRSLPRARAEMSQTRSSVEQVPFPEGSGEKQEASTRPVRNVRADLQMLGLRSIRKFIHG